MTNRGEERRWENQLSHSTKVDFPKFNAGGLDGWLLRVEYFFKVDRTPPEARVRLAALHLEGKAIQWHQGYIKTRGNEAYLDWSEYVIALNARFGQHVFDDPIADLRNLGQTGSLQSYMDEFDELYPRADIKESHALSFFLSGLIDELQMPVRMFKPQTLADAYSLARLQEIAVAALQNKPKPVSKGPSLYSPTTNHYHKATPITSISQNATNLSNTIFPKTTNAGLLPLPPSTNIPKTNPGITTRNHQNFSNRDLDERRAKGLCFWCDENLLLAINAKETTARGIRVTVANGQELHCTALCSDFRWRMQGQEFIAEGKNKLQEKMSPWADKLKGLVEQPGLFAIQDLSDATLWAIQVAENTHLEETLTPQQQEELQKMLQAFADVFEEPTGLPPVRDYDHQIDLKDEAGPINCRPYRYAAVQKDAIEKLIGEMLHAGVIRQSRSPYASPVVLVKKKDGSWRLCVDYRALNQVTVKDKFPIPVIEELLEELGGSTIFSNLTYALAIGKSECMNLIRSFSDHIHHLSIALQVLRENLLYAKSNKCFFGHSSIEYLGHVISSGGVYTDPQKVAAVRDWPTPITLKQLRAFSASRGDDNRTSACLPNFSKEFIIETDASGQGIGAVLMQEGHPIAYISKALSDRIQPAELFVLSTTILNTQLYDLIKESWGVDPELQKIIKAKEADPSAYPKYSWRGEELRRKGKLVVGVNEQLRREILNSFHDSPTGGHSGVYVTTKRISAVVYWKGLRKFVREYVRNCSVCQRFKPENKPYSGLLQPLPVPEGVFTDITMDFIEGLPKSNGKTAIFVVVDRLTKYGHFMLLPHPYTAKMVAQVFLDSVYKLHGLPHSITCDRDPIFTSVFWQEFFKLQGVSLQLSTAYHPQRTVRTEVVNRCIEPIFGAWQAITQANGQTGSH
ncbi:Transposon Ty3-I Gag-Pol polyprotein [Vitis vinifera]|uniref:Transposon Ty3-I Gag-Pol polyprotein n=1 Tax=Vitis vinifera TaxID=29760 RepID=A0A438FEN3_VITVI|nr:Transposon Ty3-I Gag-Pol polyprotein [Vitis vinifera]